MTKDLWKSRASRRRSRLAALLLCLALRAGGGTAAAVLCGAAKPTAQLGENKTLPVLQTAAAADVSELSLRSRNALLLSLESGEVLLSKAAEEPVSPGALTMVMTALVALEELDRENPAQVLPKSLFQRLLLQNAATAGFLPEEEVTAEDLLYGVLLSSGMDGAVGLARAAAGSEETLVARMNRKAQELGMANTHFTNVTGIYDPEQVTTAEDMARLLACAWENEAFRTAFTTRNFLVGPTGRHPEGLRLTNLVFDQVGIPPEGVRFLGGKAGCERESGGYFLGAAQMDGTTRLLVLLGMPGDCPNGTPSVEEAMAVFAACAGGE